MEELEVVGELPESIKLSIVQGLAFAIEDIGVYLAAVKDNQLMPDAHLIPLLEAYNKFLIEVRNASDAAKR